jgi:hypothetical protein
MQIIIVSLKNKPLLRQHQHLYEEIQYFSY